MWIERERDREREVDRQINRGVRDTHKDRERQRDIVIIPVYKPKHSPACVMVNQPYPLPSAHCLESYQTGETPSDV